MSELYVFSQREKHLTILSEDTGLVSTNYRIEVNSVPDKPFSFTVEADHENTVHVKEENKVVFKDHEGDWRLMVIREIDDSDGINGPMTTATCEPVFLAELSDHIVVDRRFVDKTADEALDAALLGTRWIGEVSVSLGLATTNFYYLSSVEAVWDILSAWGGEVKDVVDFDERTNEIKACKIQILQRRGYEHGQRFEIDHNTTEIGRTILSYPKTALYGRGSSLPIEDDKGEHTGGFTRYIDFADVEWSVSKGHPVNKPKGQVWVGDPKDIPILGYEDENGNMKHRFGIYSNQQYEDPEELLWATWNNLQIIKKPEVNYRLAAELFDEEVFLGDTSVAIDRRFARPIEIQARVIAMEYDILDIDGTTVVEMGQFLDLEDDRLEELKKEVEQIRDRPQQVTEGSFPDIKPTIPINVEAISGMGAIQLYWDYGSSIYVKHYEVYGSQLKDFVPDTQHLLWRGNTSGFLHSVGTDQVWYYRIRAVNQHGTPSDWSEQVMGATHRVVSDDILFGPNIAAELRELSKTADILADGTIYADMIRQDVYDQIQADSKQYTDAEITATEVSLMSELANKAGFDYVDGKIYLVNEELLNKVDNGVYQNKILQIDNSLDGLSLRAENVEANVNELTGEVGSALSQIAAVDIKANKISTSVNELRSDFNNLEIGGKNLLKNSDFRNTTSLGVTDKHQNLYPAGWGGYNSGIPNPTTSYHAHLDTNTFDEPVIEYNESDGNKNWKAVSPAVNIKENGEYTVSFDAYVTGGTAKLNSGLHHVKNGGETPSFGDRLDMIIDDTGGTWKRMSGRVSINDADFSKPIRLYIYGYNFPSNAILFIKRVKLEKGNKATDWTPAPEDIESRVSSAETKIDQTAYDLTFKASTQEVNSLTGRMTSAESSIRLLSDDIELKVDRDGIIGAINVQPGTVKIQARLLDVGDFTNLVDNGTFEEDEVGQVPSGWKPFSTTIARVLDQTTWGAHTGSVKCLGIYARDNGNGDLIQDRKIKVVEGDEFYIEFEYRTHNLVGNGEISVGFRTYDLQGKELGWVTGPGSTTKTYYWTKVTGSYKVPAGIGYVAPRFRFGNNGETTNRAYYDNVVIRRKNNSHLIVDGSITANLMAANSITAQNGALANASITRAKLQDAIIGTAQIDDLAVTAAKIASVNADRINVGALRGIDVYGSKFRSSDGLTNLEIIGGNVRLTQSNGQYVDVNPDGLYGKNSNGSERFRADSLLVTSRAMGTTTANVYLAAQSGKEARVVDMRDVPSDGEIGSYRYLPIRGQGFYGNYVEVNAGESGINLYLRPRNGGEVRITGANTTDVYYPLRAGFIYSSAFITTTTSAWVGTDSSLHVVAKGTAEGSLNPIYRDVRGSNFYGRSFITSSTHAYVASDSETRLVNKGFADGSSGNPVWRNLRGNGVYANFVEVNGLTSGENLYVRAIKEVIATASGTTGTYIPVRAASFPTGSMASYKEDIKEWTESALDIINRSTIYQYRLKREVESGHSRVRQGLVIGEGYQIADELIDGDGVEQYLMNSINMKGIQELDKRTLEHADEINWLKIENQHLRQKVAKLEEKISAA
ncbi:phage tail spike protein [Cytobacillus kochii]|uniref:phage tail spike protein n=1 Tax=Cytobacillus kochii TaxID=859143 RepID=UPI002040F091|nr:phage tail spike protein [Cytobacillus kochii]MCM3324234.1 phage tail protein [Cytobacillus kochii]MCM3346697.1 phage tail protein [Cytobacillus kochii]